MTNLSTKFVSFHSPFLLQLRRDQAEVVVNEYLPANLLVKFMVRIFLNLLRKNLNERRLLQFNAAEMGFRCF